MGKSKDKMIEQEQPKVLQKDAHFPQYATWLQSTFMGNNHINSAHVKLHGNGLTKLTFSSPAGLVQDQVTRIGNLRIDKANEDFHEEFGVGFTTALIRMDYLFHRHSDIHSIDCTFNDCGSEVILSYNCNENYSGPQDKRKGKIEIRG